MDIDISEIQKLLPQSIEILETLKKGGQKIAFKGKKDGKLIAIKIYNSRNSIQRIDREIEAMLKVKSDYIVDFYEFNKNFSAFDGGKSIIYSLEEYIEGKELGELLKEGNRFSVGELKIFADKILQALEEIWNYNIVHRDIKPGNIIMRENGEPVIIDFGIARHLDESTLTHSYFTHGPCTLPYAPPEMLQNKKDLIDCRSDLYSLGLVLYEMYKGKRPIWDSSKSKSENIDLMINKEINDLEEFEDFSLFISRLLEKEPYKRFKSPSLARKILNEQFI